ncbi:protein piccolo-like, partial [Limulus polyphemus]|uniref:Protein piccolo-like n=1 Tax=Limulus polyphemus TaxID=6850 RepID=A0ABM1RYS5_LIMPO
NFVASKVKHKYEFPVKRILLTSDRKEGSDSGNGLGMKIAGGREIPGSNGMIGAFIVEVSPGGVVETLGEVQEGDLVLEWNGIPLTGRTYDDVQRITKSTREEVEIVIQRMEPQAIRNEPETTSNHKHEPRSLPSSFESGDKYLSSSSSHSTVDGLVSKEQHRKGKLKPTDKYLCNSSHHS